VARDLRRLHDEEPHNVYALPYIVRIISSKWVIRAEHVARMRAMRNAYNILVGKREGKTPLGTTRHRWKSNLRM